MVTYFLWVGLGAATRKTYLTPQRLFAQFAAEYNLADLLPPSEDTICYWMAWLAMRPVRYTTIRTYLSGLRSLCVDLGFDTPLRGARILRVFRGIKISQGANSGRPPKFPITFEVLRKISPFIDRSNPSDRLIWAAITTAVSGLFRIGELTVTALASQEPHRVLRIASLSWQGSHFDLTLQASKTDPFRAGVTQHVFHPFATRAMAEYLTRRVTPLTPNAFLFASEDGKPLTRAKLITATKALLTKAGIDTSRNFGLSFRRGGATSLATAGVEDRLIKIIGRWHSAAFEVYIDTAIDQLKRVMSNL